MIIKNIFTDKELIEHFEEDTNTTLKKSRWYCLYDVAQYSNVDKAMFLKADTDNFWVDEDTAIIKKLLINQEYITGWHIETRLHQGEHLDFCIIYCPEIIKEKQKKTLKKLQNEVDFLKKQVA
ncbi:MAG: hypothetical protein GY830_07795 [Bacteroidetes bacterium]|nr:hypothetical protein [Bacteroidota bacterium]